MNKTNKKIIAKLLKLISPLRAVGYGALILVALFIAAFFALAFSNADKILYGITIGKEAVGGKDIRSAELMLNRKISGWQNAKIKLKKGADIWEASPQEMGVSIDAKKTIDAAYRVGRNKNVLQSITEQLSAAFFGQDILLETIIDDKKFDSAGARLFAGVERETKNASLEYDTESGFFDIVKEQKGNLISKNKLRADLLENAIHLSIQDITIEMKEETPKIGKLGAIGAQKKADAVLSRTPFIFIYYHFDASADGLAKPQEYKIEKDQLKDLLMFKENGNFLETNIDETALKDYLVQISPSINRTPENAILTVKEGKATEFALSKNGVELDVEQNASEIKNEILNGQSSIIGLKTNIVLPMIRTDTIENLGLVSLLATGESDFRGSPASRAFNIALAAKKLSGLLIKQGEEFSFVQAVGEISQKEGYQAALVIKGDKTIKEYGGGACQVSTTMFRAAIKSGLKITERFPHSYPVQYYNPQGFDATVYGPHPDLKFINDTPSNILVQTKIKGTKLFFEFYGTSDGRDVKVTIPVEYDKKPDGSLKAKFTREIYKDGNLVTQDTFRSNYQSPKKAPVQKNPLE